MVVITKALVLSNMSLESISAFFSDSEKPSIVTNLQVVINEGDSIVRILKEKYSLNECLANNSLSNYLQQRIETYLLTSECAIKEAGIEVDLEFCQTEEVTLDFETRRMFLMSYIGKNINSMQFFKK